MSTTTRADALMTVSHGEIDQRPWAPVTNCPGVQVQELWRSGDFVDALIRYAPGAATTGAPHWAADHHIWGVSGDAVLAGRSFGSGSYAHVPPGVAHPIVAGDAGCTLLQMHRPFSPSTGAE